MASQTRKIILVAAAARNNALGRDNRLLWHLPDDFRRFKKLTSGHHIVMGRKTFESLPGMLPNRTHIVITRSRDFRPDNCLVADSLENAIALVPGHEDVMIIGGGEIYSQSIKMADRIELTRVEADFKADTYFPEIDPGKWEITAQEDHPADDQHAYAFSFVTYERRRENQ